MCKLDFIVEILLKINSSYFSKMVLENNRNKISVLRLQHEPDNLNVNQTYLPNYRDIPNTHEE